MTREHLQIKMIPHFVGHRLLTVVCVIQFAFAFPVLLAAQDLVVAPAAEVQADPAAVHLTLPTAVQIALRHNRQIALAHLAVTDNEAQKRLAQSNYFPILKNQSAVLHITQLQGVTIPAGAIGQTTTGLLPANTLTIDQGAATTYTSGTELAQPFTQLFKIREGVKAADANLKSSRIQSDDAENGVALLVYKLYFGILIEQMRGVAAHDAVDAASILEQETKRGVDEGKLLADAELQSRSDLLDKQQTALVSRLNLDDLELQLDDALGLALGTHLVLDPDSVSTSLSVPTRADAIAVLLVRSPAVLTAREGVEKAKAGAAAARDEYIPDITGIARYSYQSGVPFLAHNFGTFGAAFTYTLFDGGRREAQRQDARIKLSMAQTQLEQAENNARIELSSAFDKIEQLEHLLSVTTHAMEAREESFRIQSERAKANVQLDSGVASAHAALTSARMNVLDARLKLYLAQNDIKRLLGQRPE